MSTAYLKSDNAGCYHNALLIVSLKSIGERAGISVGRYDFSDPQTGKDICDRKIAPMKGHIRRWVDQRHDVLTAADIKEAIDSYGGVLGCRVAVSEVDVSKAAKKIEWKGISSLFNFECLPPGIRARKAYAVGCTPYEYLSKCLQGPTSLRVIMPFTPVMETPKPGLIGAKKRPEMREDLYVCDEEGCVACFLT